MSDLSRAREILTEADRVVALTGAGMSAESGVPTFRGPGGLWKQRRPEELATPQAFARDPRLVWEWYAMRRRVIAGLDPNPGHHALARFTADRPASHILTQNVDGLHTRAARTHAAEEPLELHGSLDRDRCSACGHRSHPTAPVDASTVETLPRCARCGSLTRPDVVWFGEPLDPAVIQAAFARAGAAQVCLVVGTSAVVQPAASLPLATVEGGGVIIEVNPEPTPISSAAAVSLRGRSGEVLPMLLA